MQTNKFEFTSPTADTLTPNDGVNIVIGGDISDGFGFGRGLNSFVYT